MNLSRQILLISSIYINIYIDVKNNQPSVTQAGDYFEIVLCIGKIGRI